MLFSLDETINHHLVIFRFSAALAKAVVAERRQQRTLINCSWNARQLMVRQARWQKGAKLVFSAFILVGFDFKLAEIIKMGAVKRGITYRFPLKL